MKIHTKLILLFGVLSLLITLINGLAFIIQGEDFLAQRTKTQLESVSVLKENQLEDFINGAVRALEGIAREKVFVDNFLQSINDKNIENLQGVYYRQCRKVLEERLSGNDNFNELFFLDGEGKVYLSTNQAHEGRNESSMPYFIKAQQGTFIQSFYYSLMLKQLTTVIASPVKNDGGQTAGILAARINLAKISNTMIERSGLGETGETYLVNKFNYMVSESRFEGGLALKGTVYNDAVKDCLKGNSGHKTYNNYRDISTIGVYRWLPKTEVCLVAEISKDEALTPVKRLRNIMIVVNIAVFIFTVIVGFFLSKTITDPVGKLVKGTEQIRRGNLSYKININSKDEIGWLGQSFNEMAETLEKTTVSKTYVDSIIESMSESLIVLTPDLKISMVNRAVSELLGYKEQELINQPVEKILSVNNLDLSRETIIQKIKGGNFINQELICFSKTGREIPVLCSFALKKDEAGNATCIICTAWDITERKLAEEKAKEVAEIKSRLASMVSHELRTPLAIIRTGLYLITNGLAGRLNAEESDFFSIIKKNVDRLGRLTDDILDLHKLEIGKIKFRKEKGDINLLVSEVYEEMRPLAEQKNLQFNIQLDAAIPVAYFDRDRIIQVLNNLVSNAINFTERGHIGVITQRKDNHILVMVEDSGIGIRPQDITKIFEPFKQVEALSSKKIKGTGLGLAICKEIVEQHQGKIWAESELGNGSRFIFVLPIG
jgi:two-component system sensor histidine kinase VicK